jgi:hypothetical protein
MRCLAPLLLAACTTWPGPSAPRPPLPISQELLAPYELLGAVTEQSFVPVGHDGELSVHRGLLLCGSEQASFTLVLPPGSGRQPFVLLVPILGGGEGLMEIVAADLAGRGFAVAWARRVMSALRREQRATDIDELFRRSVVHQRMLLGWARAQAFVDEDRIACLGISTGGILAVALAACEPCLQRVVLVLAGGDLPDLFAHSEEARVVRWRGWRLADDGLSALGIAREIERDVAGEPLRFAPHLETGRVLMVGATFDRVVPWRNQLILWEALGRPRWVQVPLGHYTMALALGSILGTVAEFLVPSNE